MYCMIHGEISILNEDHLGVMSILKPFISSLIALRKTATESYFFKKLSIKCEYVFASVVSMRLKLKSLFI